MSYKPRQTSENSTDSSSETEELKEDHSLERILKKRTVNSKTEYLIKWKGFSHSYNTWETEENINRPRIVKDFEEKSKLIEQKQPSNLKRTMSKLTTVASTEESTGAGPSKDCTESTLPPTKKFKKSDTIKYKIMSPVTGTNENIKVGEPQRITKIFLSEDYKVMFKLKRKGIRKVEVISLEEARYLCPQIVIGFYQNIIQWT